MNSLSAKKHFQKSFSPDGIAALASMLNNDVSRSAMVAGISEMAERGDSVERIQGAMIFRNFLLNIAELEESPKPLPSKNLKDVPVTEPKK